LPTKFRGVHHEQDVSWPHEPIRVLLQLVCSPIVEIGDDLLGTARDGRDPNALKRPSEPGLRLSQVDDSLVKSEIIRNFHKATSRLHDGIQRAIKR
jgi:hypothetical protein